MTKIAGVHNVVCTCGRDMVRTGGVYGSTIMSTYACRSCGKAVNAIDLSEEAVKELFEGMKWTYEV